MLAVAELALDIAKVRNLRLKLGLTHEQAATAAGFTSRQQWYGIESGRTGTDVSVSTLGKLARALKCDPDDLLTTPED
jgi:transcriptional regulator with XRE-family HTH domain